MSQFPVSSGKQHQLVENTWVPVTTSTAATTSSTTTSTSTASSSSSKQVMTLQKQIQEQLPELAKPKPPPLPAPPAPPLNPVLSRPYDWKSDDHYCKTIFPTLAPPPDVRFIAFRIKNENFMWILFFSHIAMSQR